MKYGFMAAYLWIYESFELSSDSVLSAVSNLAEKTPYMRVVSKIQPYTLFTLYTT